MLHTWKNTTRTRLHDRQWAKVCLAYLDARLILENRYETSYWKKRTAWETLARTEEETAWLGWAIEHKLGRRDHEPPAERGHGWTPLARFYLERIYALASRAYGRSIPDAEAYEAVFRGVGRRDMVGVVVDAVRRGRRRRRKASELMKLFLAEALCHEHEPAGETSLQRAVDHARTVGYEGAGRADDLRAFLIGPHEAAELPERTDSK